MPSFGRRFIGAAFLSLFILLGQAGLTGWFCADGHRCAPAFAAACCCARAPVASPADDCCDRETEAGHAVLAAPHCGCYYSAQALPCLLRAEQAPASAPALSIRAAPAISPSTCFLCRVALATPDLPPPLASTPSPSRAPPAA